MTDHPCSQTQTISDLKTNQAVFMEKLNTIWEEQKKQWVLLASIHSFMFEGGMDNKYAKKQSVDRLWTIVWGIIGLFFTGAGVVLINKIFQ